MNFIRKKEDFLIMDIYPTNLTYELPLNENDYIRKFIDLSVNRNN